MYQGNQIKKTWNHKMVFQAYVTRWIKSSELTQPSKKLALDRRHAFTYTIRKVLVNQFPKNKFSKTQPSKL